MPRKRRVYNRKYDVDKIFGFIKRRKAENDGNSPTLRQIGIAMAMPSSSTVNTYLDILREQGRIESEKGEKKEIKVSRGVWLYLPDFEQHLKNRGTDQHQLAIIMGAVEGYKGAK